MELNRRSTLKVMFGAGVGSCLYGSKLFAAEPEASTEPHYFLQIHINGALDCSYLFDARPLEMTAAKLQVNYLGQESIKLTGSNGGETWRSPLTEPLMKHFDRLSVINGTMMSPTFDGHEQNENFLFSGNAFGGESFIPYLNQVGRRSPLDFVKTGDGFSFAALTNTGNSAPISLAAAKSLVEKIGASSKLSQEEKLPKFLHERMLRHANKKYKFGQGSSLFATGFETSAELQKNLKSMTIDENERDPAIGAAKVATSVFKSGAARAALMMFSGQIANVQVDSHDFENASKYPALIREYVSNLDKVLNHLKQTAYDDKRSFLDLTTVIVTTEMSRTMRAQFGGEFESSGTDHNSLRNSILIGGRGIKGGMVVGESDFRTSGETLSGAHLALDGVKKHIMARPFDFGAMRPRTDLPVAYNAPDYISCLSITNTVLKMFGVPKEKYFALDRSGTIAKTLDGILA